MQVSIFDTTNDVLESSLAFTSPGLFLHDSRISRSSNFYQSVFPSWPLKKSLYKLYTYLFIMFLLRRRNETLTGFLEYQEEDDEELRSRAQDYYRRLRRRERNRNPGRKENTPPTTPNPAEKMNNAVQEMEKGEKVHRYTGFKEPFHHGMIYTTFSCPYFAKKGIKPRGSHDQNADIAYRQKHNPSPSRRRHIPKRNNLRPRLQPCSHEFQTLWYLDKLDFSSPHVTASSRRAKFQQTDERGVGGDV